MGVPGWKILNSIISYLYYPIATQLAQKNQLYHTLPTGWHIVPYYHISSSYLCWFWFTLEGWVFVCMVSISANARLFVTEPAFFACCNLVAVSTITIDAVDYLERLVSKLICYISSVMLSCAHLLGNFPRYCKCDNYRCEFVWCGRTWVLEQVQESCSTSTSTTCHRQPVNSLCLRRCAILMRCCAVHWCRRSITEWDRPSPLPAPPSTSGDQKYVSAA